jgi:murein DD-endopeptidase MepM/ murein hydrolase activator NlpD
MKPTTLFLLGTCSFPLALLAAAGLPSWSQMGALTDLPPIPTPLIPPPSIRADTANEIDFDLNTVDTDLFVSTPDELDKDSDQIFSDSVAEAPSTLWIRTQEDVDIVQLADELDLSTERLAQLNGVSIDHSFSSNRWVLIPGDREGNLFMVGSLDDSTLQKERPNDLTHQPLLAKVSALHSTMANAAMGSAHARRGTLAIIPTSSGGLSWPPLPDFGNLRRPELSGFIWPAKGSLTSGYGWRWGRMHKGIDVANSVGTPILAAADGRVVFSGWSSGGYGYLVELAHIDGSKTRYAHNSRLLVRKGMQVRQGTPIARMGSTGRSTGPHLHFEIHRPGRGAVNPMRVLASRG